MPRLAEDGLVDEPCCHVERRVLEVAEAEGRVIGNPRIMEVMQQLQVVAQ